MWLFGTVIDNRFIKPGKMNVGEEKCSLNEAD